MKLLTAFSFLLAATAVQCEMKSSTVGVFEGRDVTISCEKPVMGDPGDSWYHANANTNSISFITLGSGNQLTDGRKDRYTINNDVDKKITSVTIKNANIQEDSGDFYSAVYDLSDWSVKSYDCKITLVVFSKDLISKEGTCYTFHYKEPQCKLDKSFETATCDSLCPAPADCSGSDIIRCGATAEEQKEIVDTHNQLRQLIASGGSLEGRAPAGTTQPKGTNLYELKWNDDLARLAQRWSEQLIWEHDCGSCRKVGEFTSVGQNMALRGDKEKAWAGATEAWFSEVKFYDYATNSANTAGEAVGHYTQVVWAKSKLIGCGALQKTASSCTWAGADLTNIPDCANFVCNYYPAGNMDKQLPYSTTEPCPNGPSDNYPNLCKH